MAQPRVRVTTLLTCLAVIAGACAPPPMPPEDTRRTILSLRNLDCIPCGEDLARELAREEGVESAKFDREDAEVIVEANPAFDAYARAEELKGGGGYEVVEGAGKGGYSPLPALGADVRTLAHAGEDVSALVPVRGKVTVFDFGAVWCEPCKVLEQHLDDLAKQRADLAYRKLDIGEWHSPLSKHYLTDVEEVPYVVVYGKDGERVAAISGLDVQRVDDAIAAGSIEE